MKDIESTVETLLNNGSVGVSLTQLVDWLNELIAFRKASKSLKLKPSEQYIVTEGEHKGEILAYEDLPESFKAQLPKPVTNEDLMPVLRSIQCNTEKLLAFLNVDNTQSTPTELSELQHQIDIDTTVIDDLRTKVLKWHGLAKDIVTVLGSSTAMLHDCMDSWINRMVDSDEKEEMKALAQNIVDRMHEIKHSAWGDPLFELDPSTLQQLKDRTRRP